MGALRPAILSHRENTKNATCNIGVHAPRSQGYLLIGAPSLAPSAPRALYHFVLQQHPSLQRPRKQSEHDALSLGLIQIAQSRRSARFCFRSMNSFFPQRDRDRPLAGLMSLLRLICGNVHVLWCSGAPPFITVYFQESTQCKCALSTALKGTSNRTGTQYQHCVCSCLLQYDPPWGSCHAFHSYGKFFGIKLIRRAI